jgi:hypothetical protein
MAEDEEGLEEGQGGAPMEQAYQERLARLATLTREELIEYGDYQLLLQLIARVDLGVASHQEMSVLRAVLNDQRLVLAKLNPPKDPKLIGNVSPEAVGQGARLPAPNQILMPQFEDEDDGEVPAPTADG